MQTTQNLDDVILERARRPGGPAGSTPWLPARVPAAGARRQRARARAAAAAPRPLGTAGHAPLLVDTSVRVEHLPAGLLDLAAALESGQLLTHPLDIGELACGQLRQRAENLHFIDAHPLQGRGLGWIDIHLLAAASALGLATP
jgi:hypothetical protein